MKPLPDSWRGTYAHELGMVFTAVSEGHSEAELEIRPEHCNPNGVCHGGALFTLADDSMGAASHHLCPDGYVPASTQVNIHYARSVRAGDRVRVETDAIAHGRRTAVMRSQISDQDGRLVALATASYLFVEASRTP